MERPSGKLHHIRGLDQFVLRLPKHQFKTQAFVSDVGHYHVVFTIDGRLGATVFDAPITEELVQIVNVPVGTGTLQILAMKGDVGENSDQNNLTKSVDYQVSGPSSEFFDIQPISATKVSYTLLPRTDAQQPSINLQATVHLLDNLVGPSSNDASNFSDVGIGVHTIDGALVPEIRETTPGIPCFPALSGQGTGVEVFRLIDESLFDVPVAVAADRNFRYVADASRKAILKIPPRGAPPEFFSEFQSENLDGVTAVAVDAASNIYAATAGLNNHRIWKITPKGQFRVVAGSGKAGYADGAGKRAKFNGPNAIATDGAGNLFIADTFNDRIRMIDPQGNVTTYAGTGDGTDFPRFRNGFRHNALFSSPTGVALDGKGSLYVADQGNFMIRKINASGTVTTLAGGLEPGFADIPRSAARFGFFKHLAADECGNVYLGDIDFPSSRIRKITAAGDVSTIAGGEMGATDGPGTVARFNYPLGIAIDSFGRGLVIADPENGDVRHINDVFQGEPL